MEEEEEEIDEEEEGEDDKEEEKTVKQMSYIELPRASSNTVLLPSGEDFSEGLINPAFSQDDGQTVPRPKPFRGRPVKSPRLTCLSRHRPYGYCRSLSSSMENMTFSGAPLSPTRGSFPSFNEAMNKESLCGGRNFREDSSLQCSRSKGIVLVCA